MLAGEVWPAVPAPAAALLLALLYQLQHSERWPPEQILAHQFRQLAVLLRHAVQTVPWYRERLAFLGPHIEAGTVTPELWRRIPLLKRGDLQAHSASIFSERTPPEHGEISIASTSGSTGQRVSVMSTALCAQLWHAHTLRDHLWHQRDLGRKLAVIRYEGYDRVAEDEAGAAPGRHRDAWGMSAAILGETGPAVALEINTELSRQAEWLAREKPDYLLTYPSNLQALAGWFREHGAKQGLRPPPLIQARTLGEVVSTRLRHECREIFGAPVVDTYSTQETGYVALQCPLHEHYHIQSESALVEVLDADGEPCAPGETGRVVLTALHNFAMPLIRYDVGDYAEVGGPCDCGRTLPVLSRVAGRVRNVLVLPDGRRYWPLLWDEAYTTVAPVRRFQLVQHTLEELELRFVADRPLTAVEEDALRETVRMRFAHPFRVQLTPCLDLERGAGGKFEDFRSEVSAQDSSS